MRLKSSRDSNTHEKGFCSDCSRVLGRLVHYLLRMKLHAWVARLFFFYGAPYVRRVKRRAIVKIRFLKKIRFAIFPIFRTESDNWFRSLLPPTWVPLPFTSPFILHSSLTVSSFTFSNVGMQLLNAASAPPFSRRWKMRARRRLRRLNLCHLSARPWLLDVPFRLSASPKTERRRSTRPAGDLSHLKFHETMRGKCRIDFFFPSAFFSFRGGYSR